MTDNCPEEFIMGCWGINSFDNDDASDWVADLIEEDNPGLVQETIAEVLAIDGYLESSFASQALAAIEVVAAAMGHPTASCESNVELMEWMAKTKPSINPPLVREAIAIIDRITGSESEL